jgi:hypothetical protein
MSIIEGNALLSHIGTPGDRYIRFVSLEDAPETAAVEAHGKGIATIALHLSIREL